MKEQLNRKRKGVSVSLQGDTIKELDRKARALGIPRSQVVEVTLRDALGMLDPKDAIAPKIRLA